VNFISGSGGRLIFVWNHLNRAACKYHVVMASGGRRGTFAFDLSKPLKKGMLLKQGQLHKAFKHRFFVLYPGFLVYYDDMSRWKLDITRGETLGVSYITASTLYAHL